MDIRTFYECTQDGADWTEAFRSAVDTLARQGGGEIEVPAGTYPTGPIELKSHITLWVRNGARLVFHTDPGRFPLVDLEDGGEPGPVYQACIYARGAEHVCVRGDGILDAQGSSWWRRHRERSLPHPRPRFVCFDSCSHVRLEGVTLLNSPSWTVHPLRCRFVTIQGVTILNPPDSPNTDGINPESCRDVRILFCTVDVGDDCIALKAGTEHSSRVEPCERILIEGCHLLHGHGGVVLGSETRGSIRNVTISNCFFYQTDRGIRLKTRRGRGGTVEGLQAFQLNMEDVQCPFVFNMYYHCGSEGKRDLVRSKAPLPVTGGTPRLSDVSISSVSVRGCTACAGFFFGLPEQPVEGVLMRDVRVEMAPSPAAAVPAMMDDCPPMAGAGFYLRNARRVRFESVTGTNLLSPLTDTDASVDLVLQGGISV